MNDMSRAQNVRSAIEHVGQFEFKVEVAEATPEASERWNRRAEVLAAWLLDEWRRQHQEAA